MRIIGEDEEAGWVEDVPECAYRAPCPMILSGEHHLHIAYRIQSEPPADWDGTRVRLVGEETEGGECCILSFRGVVIYSFESGGGNDGGSHPLQERGLEPYALYEIKNSRWGMSNGNRTHYIFMFHDTTFECVALGYSFKTKVSSVSAAIRAVVREV